jgi:hypothetical protein
MKFIKLLLVVATVSVTILLSCKKNGASSDFDKSYNAWLAYKAKVNDTYAYIAIKGDQSTVYSETTIKVVQGNIIARDFLNYEYKYTAGNNTPTKVLTVEWHETSGNIGTHGTDAADLYTLDDIYYRAQNIWLKADKSKNVVTFESNNNGMISFAGYTPNTCKSDCFIGINIKSITN